MAKRFLIYGLLGSIIQVAIYTVLLKLIQGFQTLIFTKNHREIISFFDLQISIFVFITIVTIQNISTTLINKKWFTKTAFGFATLLCVVSWGEDLKTCPIKTTLYLLVGIFTLSIKFYIDKRLTSWQKDNK